MKETKRSAALGGLAVLGCILAVFCGGCGDGESAGSDPAARAQSEADAKNAMLATSKMKSGGVSQEQSTRNAMEAGSRQQ
jgi:hypothetical protein